MIARGGLAIAFVLGAAGTAAADPFVTFDGYVDGRIVVPSDRESWFDGSLGKLRWSDDDNGIQFGEAVGSVHVQATEDIGITAVARIENYQKTFIDIMEGYVRYRPVSTSAWRWSVKAGAFFPPISLENTEVGWTSPWTLTPSAINTWVGDELRTIGAEAEVEWRSEPRTIALRGAVFGYNDPAGVELAFRGWIFEDHPSTLIDRQRLPDALATSFGLKGPIYAQEFNETDGRLGWYAGADWNENDVAQAHVLYYDNRTDPDSFHHGDFGWHTRFWSVGAQTAYGDFVLMSQAMWGKTTVSFGDDVYSTTDFRSAYVLAGWYLGDHWRIAARADWFQNRDNLNLFAEDGHAFTFAVNYVPYDWLRLTAEIIQVISKRDQRLIDGDRAWANETQLQISARLYLPQ